MARSRKTKISGEIFDFTFDWSDLLLTGESISTSTWVAGAVGITIETYSNTTTTTTVWLSGGTAGETYKFTNPITTDNSPQRTRIRELFVKVQD